MRPEQRWRRLLWQEFMPKQSDIFKMSNKTKIRSVLSAMRNPAPSSRLQVVYGLPGGFQVPAPFGDLVGKHIAGIVPFLARERFYTAAQLLGPGLWSALSSTEARLAVLYVATLATKGAVGLTVTGRDTGSSVRFARTRSQQPGKRVEIVVRGRSAASQAAR